MSTRSDIRTALENGAQSAAQLKEKFGSISTELSQMVSSGQLRRQGKPRDAAAVYSPAVGPDQKRKQAKNPPRDSEPRFPRRRDSAPPHLEAALAALRTQQENIGLAIEALERVTGAPA